MNADARWLDYFLIYALTLFNIVLCFIFGLGVEFGSEVVVAIQIGLFILLCGLLFFRLPNSGNIILLLLIVFLLCLYSFFINKDIVAKDFFAVLIVPISILYARVVRLNVWVVVRVLFFISLTFIFFEVYYLEFLTKIFPAGEYLANTRGWIGAQVGSGSTQLYIGAYRAGGSYFFPEIHRVGSFFLEPLTNGYFYLLVILAARVFVRGTFLKLFYISFAVLCVFLTDSRMSLGLSILFVFFPLRKINVCIPVFFLLVFILVIAYLGSLLPRDLAGELPLRLGYTFDGVASNHLGALIGLLPFEGKTNDAGFLVYVSALGFLGVFCLFLFLEYQSYIIWRDSCNSIFICFLITYFVSLLFGYAFLSAKLIVLWVVFAVQSSKVQI